MYSGAALHHHQAAQRAAGVSLLRTVQSRLPGVGGVAGARRLPGAGLWRMPHVQGGERRRYGRARPRQGEGRRGEGAPRLRDAVHQRVDRRSGRVRCARIPERDAARLQGPDPARQAQAARAVSGGEREVTELAHAHEHHEGPPARTGIHRWTGPGWLRVLWVTPIFFGIGIALPLLIRYLAHWQPYWKGSVILTVELVTTPLGFL